MNSYSVRRHLDTRGRVNNRPERSPMTKHLGQWIVLNSGLVSVLGALIIFFSWSITNTLGQRYARLKQSVEAGDATFRLYTSLHELRDSLNSVIMETVYAREAVERRVDTP